jgi:hypothetical protein
MEWFGNNDRCPNNNILFSFITLFRGKQDNQERFSLIFKSQFDRVESRLETVPVPAKPDMIEIYSYLKWDRL